MSNKLPPEDRVPFMEHHWMGDGISDAQRKAIAQLLEALDHYAQGPDGGFALHALKVEAARRPGHASILGKYVTDYDPETDPNLPASYKPELGSP